MSKSSDFLASNLTFLMERHGLNPNSLAEALKKKPPQPTIHRILSGEHKSPQDKTVAPIAEYFGVSIQALRYDDLTLEVTFVQPLFVSTLASSMKARKVVVLNTGNGLPEKIWDDTGAVMGISEGFAIIASDDDRAFLVPVTDNQLAPRFNMGEFALVEPHTAPEIEDDVLLRLKTGELMLRRLVSRRSGVKVGFYSSAETQTFAETDISWMYYVPNPIPARKVRR